MSSERSRIEQLRYLPVISFYLPNDAAYADYKRQCESHLSELYAADEALNEIVAFEIAKGILRANITKRREHAGDAERLAATGRMRPFAGAVPIDQLGEVAEDHLVELISNQQLPSMELEALITVGEDRPFLDRLFPDQVSDGVVDFLNADRHGEFSVNVHSQPAPSESIKLSRIDEHSSRGRYAVVKSKAESTQVIAVEADQVHRGRLQVIGRQTSMLWLDELSHDASSLLERLDPGTCIDDEATIEDVKQDAAHMLKEQSKFVHPVIERAYARRVDSE